MINMSTKGDGTPPERFAFLDGCRFYGDLPADPAERLQLVSEIQEGGNSVSDGNGGFYVAICSNVVTEFWIERGSRDLELTVHAIWEKSKGAGCIDGPADNWRPPEFDSVEAVFLECAGLPFTGYLSDDEMDDLELKVRAVGILQERGIEADRAMDQAADIEKDFRWN